MKHLYIRNVPARKESEPHSLPVRLARRALIRAAGIFALPLVSLSCGGSGRGPADASVADYVGVEDAHIANDTITHDGVSAPPDRAAMDNRPAASDGHSDPRDGAIADRGMRDDLAVEDRPCIDGSLVERTQTQELGWRLMTARYWIEPGTTIARVEVGLIAAEVVPHDFVRLRVRGYDAEGRLYEERTIVLDRNPTTTSPESAFVGIGGSVSDRLNRANVRFNNIINVYGVRPCHGSCDASISVIREFQTCD